MPELCRFLGMVISIYFDDHNPPGGKTMPFWVINAELREDYTIYIEFNDGTSGVIDFQNKIKTDHRSIIKELLNKDTFKAIKIERHTLCWANGVDFAPEYLYDQVKMKGKAA
jgi:hypothetical protein